MKLIMDSVQFGQAGYKGFILPSFRLLLDKDNIRRLQCLLP